MEGSKKLVSATTAQGQHPTIVEAGTALLQDHVSLKLDALIRTRSYPGRRQPEGGGGDEEEAMSTLSVTFGSPALKDFCFHNLDYDPDRPWIINGIPLHQHSFLEPPTKPHCPLSQQSQGLVERDSTLHPR